MVACPATNWRWDEDHDGPPPSAASDTPWRPSTARRKTHAEEQHLQTWREGTLFWAVRDHRPPGGGTGQERTAVRGEPLPPTPKSGQGYRIADRTKNKSGRGG